MTTTAQLHRNLEEKQAEITGIARQIEHRLDAYRDWPQLVRKHPLESVGLAVGAGLVLSNSTGALFGWTFRQVGMVARATAAAYLLARLTQLTETPSVQHAVSRHVER